MHSGIFFDMPIAGIYITILVYHFIYHSEQISSKRFGTTYYFTAPSLGTSNPKPPLADEYLHRIKRWYT